MKASAACAHEHSKTCGRAAAPPQRMARGSIASRAARSGGALACRSGGRTARATAATAPRLRLARTPSHASGLEVVVVLAERSLGRRHAPSPCRQQIPARASGRRSHDIPVAAERRDEIVAIRRLIVGEDVEPARRRTAAPMRLYSASCPPSAPRRPSLPPRRCAQSVATPTARCSLPHAGACRLPRAAATANSTAEPLRQSRGIAERGARICDGRISGAAEAASPARVGRALLACGAR